MNLSDAEMRALVRLGYSLALSDVREKEGRKGDRKAIADANADFKDGISLARLNEIISHVPPDAIRDELVAAGLRSSTGRLP
jgi:tyrosyl-tRNA synthetase